MSQEETYRQEQDTRTESRRQCPYCDETPLSRGIYAHVMNSQDNAHGEFRSVPEGFNPREAEIVGQEKLPDNSVEVEPDEDGPVNQLYLCTLCGNFFKGNMGYKVHLAKVAGDDVHPQDVDIDDEHYAKIPADEDYEPTIPEDRVKAIEEREMGVSEAQDSAEGDTENGREAIDESGVPVEELRELMDRFGGKGEVYEEVEEEVEAVIARHS